MKIRVFNYISISFIALLASSQAARAQSATEFAHPIVDGERALRFRVNTNNLRAEDLNVRVFYSVAASRLNNLNDTSLSRGRPVLKPDSANAQALSATFVFPHRDFPRDPNRSLYIRYKQIGLGIVLYSQVEAQLGQLVLPPNSPIDTNPRIHAKGTCVFYRVRISANGQAVFTSETKSFRMPDTYNIGIAGDSYGAGEGAPDDNVELGGDNSDMWTQQDCHRSNKSGLVRGVKFFIQRNPDVAVDYLHVACTGAGISNLITQEQTRAVFDFSSPHPIQFDLIRDELLGSENQNHNELHLLLLSIGGNNAGFGSYVVNFIVAPFNAADDPNLPDDIPEDLEALGDAYDNLNEGIRERFPSAKVAVATYPDSTRGPLGFCNTLQDFVPREVTYFCCIAEVNPITNPREEYVFTSTQFISPLNETIRASANDHGWAVIDVENRMGAHGICDCAEPYINRIGDSILIQGDILGLVHPNSKGYREVYKEPVGDRVENLHQQFVAERTAGIFLAILLGIESPAIPQPCPAANALTALSDLLRLLGRIKVADRPAWLDDFVFDKDVRDALDKGDMSRLKLSTPYKTLLTRRAEAMKIIAATFPQPTKRLVNPELLKPPASVLRAEARARIYLRSKQFRDLVARLKARARGARVRQDEDELDSLFNRKKIKGRKRK